MPLYPMHILLKDAQKRQYGIIATNLLNLEMIKGGIDAAERCQSPLILQLAPVQFATAPLHLVGPMMVAAAHAATVPVAVHLDHGFDQTIIQQALDLGFSSVMIDASMHTYDDNIAYTRRVVEQARPYGATVEAELGHVGEESLEAHASTQQRTVGLTEPAMAQSFVETTHCDALAVAIGNAHGLYRVTPNLDIDRLKSIRSLVSVPLVLHGGSGTSEADFKASIQAGITKINIASAIHKAYLDAIKPTDHYGDHCQSLETAVSAMIEAHMIRFGSVGKASDFSY